MILRFGVSQLKKPAIEPLDPDKTKYKKLRTILNSKSVGSYRQRSLQRSIVGECCICAAIPTKRVIHDKDGASLIEKYCDKCFAKCDKNERRRQEDRKQPYRGNIMSTDIIPYSYTRYVQFLTSYKGEKNN